MTQKNDEQKGYWKYQYRFELKKKKRIEKDEKLGCQFNHILCAIIIFTKQRYECLEFIHNQFVSKLQKLRNSNRNYKKKSNQNLYIS